MNAPVPMNLLAASQRLDDAVTDPTKGRGSRRVHPAVFTVLKRADRLLRALLRLLSLIAACGSFLVVALLVLLRYWLPEAWTADEDLIVGWLIVTAATSALLAFIARNRSPVLQSDLTFSGLAGMARPTTVLVFAVLTIVGAIVLPILPGPGEEPPSATEIISTLTAVASVILAGAFAWLTSAVTRNQHASNAAHELAFEFLEVSRAARRLRMLRMHASAPADHLTVIDARDDLIDALRRTANSTKGRARRRGFVSALADQGVQLTVEGVLARLGDLPLGPIASRYGEAIDAAIGGISDGALLVDLEVFAEELAARARAGEASSSSEYAQRLRSAADAAHRERLEADRQRAHLDAERGRANRAAHPPAPPTETRDDTARRRRCARARDAVARMRRLFR